MHVVVLGIFSNSKSQRPSEMTFDLVLSSLLYHGREWFVFQDILTHLPQEKAAVATQRSKTTQKYTYRFGITRDWVTGDGKKILVDRHFIDSNDPGRSLIFSSVLIDAERVQELFLESFNKRFRLKVQQFHLTATSLDSAWFEWHFDPKQKDGCVVKKTKLTVEESKSQSSKESEKTPQKTQNSDSENMTPNLSDGNRQSPLSLKRRRTVLDNGDQASVDYQPSISETVLMRPRKKAKEANLSICKYLYQQEDEKPDMDHKEPMSPDYKPDLANFHSIKRSLSPMEKPKIKLSPSSSPQTIIKDDVMLSSVRDNNTDSDTDFISTSNDTPQETNTVPQESSAKSQNSDNLSENGDTVNDIVLQDNLAIDGQDMPDEGNVPKDDEVTGDPDSVGNTQQNVGNVSDNNSTADYNNSADNSSVDDGNVPDSNIPDDANLGPQNEPTSPTSSLLDNTNKILENIQLQKQELCTEEEETVVVDSHSSELPSTSADTNILADTHNHDCGAEACTSNGASSTVCLCTKEETSKQETSTEKVKSTGIACVLLLFTMTLLSIVTVYSCCIDQMHYLPGHIKVFYQYPLPVLKNSTISITSICDIFPPSSKTEFLNITFLPNNPQSCQFLQL